MAKEELDRVSINASEAAVNVKQQDIALLLKKKDADDQQTNKTEAEAPVDQAAVVETQDEALMVASADSVFASDGAYMVAAADGAGGAGGSSGLSTGTLLAIGGVALVGGGIAIAASDSNDGPKNVPTAVAASATSVNEGQTVTFNVTGTPNTTLTYVLTGVQAADVQGGLLTGTVEIGSDGTGVIAVTLLEDNLTEGAETLTVTVDGATASTTVNDTSLNQPQNLTSAVETVNGTDQDDVFNGTVTAGGFGPITGETLNAGDVINGLGGDDTLNISYEGSPFGGAFVANVTTNSVENINVGLNTLSGNQTSYLDGVGLNDVQDFTINLNAPNSNGFFGLVNMSGDLDTFTINGGDRNPSHASGFGAVVTGGSDPLTIDTVSVSNLQGNAFIDIGGASFTGGSMSNIPDLVLTNIATSTLGGGGFSATALVGVLDSATDTALSVTVDEVGSIANGSAMNVAVVNASGSDVVESIALNVAGGTDNVLAFGSTSLLETVTVTGPGDIYLAFSDSSQVSTFNASTASGDIAVGLTNTVDLVATLGSGNDLLGLQGSGSVDISVSMGAGNDILGLSHSGSADIAVSMGLGNDLVALNSGTADTAIDLGAGDDVLIVANGQFTSDDSATGGDGFDSLAMDASDFTSSNLSAVSGFENVIAQGSTGTYDMSLLSGVTTLTVGGFDLASGPDYLAGVLPDSFVQVSTVGAGYYFSNAAASVASLVLNFNNTNYVTVDRAVDNSSNSLTVQIGNSFGDETTGANVYDQLFINYLQLTDEESVTFNSTGYQDDLYGTLDGSTDVNIVNQLQASDLTTLTITGDKDLSFSGTITAALLTKIDASAFTGNLTIASPINGVTDSIEFLGGSGHDTYFGTIFGDTINAGGGGDNIDLNGAGIQDTLIFSAGDSMAGTDAFGFNNFDTYTGFEGAGSGGIDSIDVGAFGFTGQQASGLKDADSSFAAIAAADDSTVIADFFNSAGIDRGVAVSSDGTDTYVIIDANKDGNFNGDTDLVIFFQGNPDDITLANFGF